MYEYYSHSFLETENSKEIYCKQLFIITQHNVYDIFTISKLIHGAYKIINTFILVDTSVEYSLLRILSLNILQPGNGILWPFILTK